MAKLNKGEGYKRVGQIINVTREILQDDWCKTPQIRTLANKIDATPPVIYHHFDDLAGLFESVGKLVAVEVIMATKTKAALDGPVITTGSVESVHDQGVIEGSHNLLLRQTLTLGINLDKYPVSATDEQIRERLKLDMLLRDTANSPRRQAWGLVDVVAAEIDRTSWPEVSLPPNELYRELGQGMLQIAEKTL